MSAIPHCLKLDREELARLCNRPWWALPLQLTVVLGGYVGLSVVAVWLSVWPVWLVAWWFQGFILSGFLGAAHDCAHGRFVLSRRWSRIFGAVWASLVLFNFSLYKYFHLKHHRYTAVEGDTEPSGLFPSVWAYFKHLPTWAFFTSLWKMSFDALWDRYPDFVTTAEARRDVRQDNLPQFGWMLLLVGLTILHPRAVTAFYWMPMAFYFPMVFLTSLPEHYGCDAGDDPQRNTRTITSNWLFRLLFWNGNYHAEHHLYAHIPSWNLPKLHERTRPHLEFVEKSYVRFHLNLIWTLLRGKPQNTSAFQRAPDPATRVHFTNETHPR